MGSIEFVSSERAVKRGRLTVFFLLHVQAKVTHMPDVLKMCECGNKGKRQGKKKSPLLCGLAKEKAAVTYCVLCRLISSPCDMIEIN